MGDEEPTDLHRARLVLVDATRVVLANGLALLGVRRPNGCDQPHEAGWAHAAGALDGPSWLRAPDDVNALHPLLWAVRRDAATTVGSRSAGSTSATWLAEHNSPAYVLDEADFRQRAQAFRNAFADYDVFYAGKAFLCTTVARWVRRRG